MTRGPSLIKPSRDSHHFNRDGYGKWLSQSWWAEWVVLRRIKGWEGGAGHYVGECNPAAFGGPL